MNKKEKRRRPPTKGVLFVRELPPRLKDIFYSICVRRHITLRDAIICLMYAYTQDPTAFKVSRRIVDQLYEPGKEYEE